jgi:4-amino-4-deoxychorismate lyase
MPAIKRVPRILTDREVLEQSAHAARESSPSNTRPSIRASSEASSPIPALMVIPFDDHMVHRGHGIFDTAGIVNGRIYDLDAHLDRFLKSANARS